MKEKQLDELISLDTRKISENFQKKYNIDKKNLNKTFNNDCSIFENVSYYPSKDQVDENFDLHSLSINSELEKKSIISLVFQSDESADITKFSIHKNEEKNDIKDYSHPFGE